MVGWLCFGACDKVEYHGRNVQQRSLPGRERARGSVEESPLT
jgi:hypothetical protein